MFALSIEQAWCYSKPCAARMNTRVLLPKPSPPSPQNAVEQDISSHSIALQCITTHRIMLHRNPSHCIVSRCSVLLVESKLCCNSQHYRLQSSRLRILLRRIEPDEIVDRDTININPTIHISTHNGATLHLRSRQGVHRHPSGMHVRIHTCVMCPRVQLNRVHARTCAERHMHRPTCNQTAHRDAAMYAAVFSCTTILSHVSPNLEIHVHIMHTYP